MLLVCSLPGNLILAEWVKYRQTSRVNDKGVHNDTWLAPYLVLAMKRRTFKQLSPWRQPDQHHNVYVVLLAPAVAKLRKVRALNPGLDAQKPCVYVGMTGLTPEERFANHRAGIKDAPLVKRFGVRLLPELYAHLNPMPFEAAVQMEKDLAEDLRRAGYTVTGGH
jgi:hypothetical protein